MFFHRRQHAQVTLHSPGVVITDVALNHLHEFLFAGEMCIRDSAKDLTKLDEALAAAEGFVADMMAN